VEWLPSGARPGPWAFLFATDPAGWTEEIRDTSIGPVAHLSAMAEANVPELLCETAKRSIWRTVTSGLPVL
jgi:hypothetical protein